MLVPTLNINQNDYSCIMCSLKNMYPLSPSVLLKGQGDILS